MFVSFIAIESKSAFPIRIRVHIRANPDPKHRMINEEVTGTLFKFRIRIHILNTNPDPYFSEPQLGRVGVVTPAVSVQLSYPLFFYFEWQTAVEKSCR
jgi:hypothetical protein